MIANLKKSEMFNQCELFINEVSEELGVEFKKDLNMRFQRTIYSGRKKKVANFTSSLFTSKSDGYLIKIIPYSDDAVELWKINVKNRGKGYGSQIMNKILDVSDRMDIKIKLIPVDYDIDENTPIDYLNRLKNWYCRMGFNRPKFPSIDPFYTYYPSVEEFKSVA